MITKLSKRLHRVTAARRSGKPIRMGHKAAMWHASRSCKVDMRWLDQLSDSLHLPQISKWEGKSKIRSGSPTAENRTWCRKVNIHSAWRRVWTEALSQPSTDRCFHYKKLATTYLLRVDFFIFSHVEQLWRNLSWHSKRNDSVEFYTVKTSANLDAKTETEDGQCAGKKMVSVLFFLITIIIINSDYNI